MPPRARRNTKRVDYSKFADPSAQNGADSDGDEEVKDADLHESDNDDDDVLEDGDDEPIDEDVTEDETIAEETPKAKAKSKKAPKTKKSTTPQPENGNNTPVKEIRLTKHITNLKEKFYRFYGANEDKLVEVLKLRRTWESSMFDFPSSQLKEYIPSVTIKDVPKAKFTELSKEQFNEKFPLERSINFSYNENPSETIAPGGIAPNQRAQVINTGGLVTDIAWLSHGSETAEQILAVAVSDISDTAIAPEFSLLGYKNYKSGFLIYSLDTQTYTLTLIKAVIHNWGNSWDLQWKNHRGMGVLSAVFNDGKVRLIHFDYEDEKDVSYTEITEPSFEYELPNMKITSYDWLGDKIICGTESGYVAEFVLGDKVPSYVHHIQSGYIFSIRSAESKYDETMILTSCADGSCALMSTKDFQSTKVITPKTKSISKSIAYSRQLYSFVQLDAQYSAKLTLLRSLFVVTSVVKHDGSTESIATSNLHPMLLSGGADGKVKITNLMRRILNGQKQTLSNHKILTLWELQYSANEDLYRLVDNLKVETLSSNDNTNVSNIYPPGVSINSIKWNENENAGKWYAAGSTSGLVIVGSLQ